ncbi:hypothetical protein ACP4OV_009950 [Aristida adscensionis]
MTCSRLKLDALASGARLAADVFLGNTLVTASSKLQVECLDSTTRVFDKMPARDLVSSNALLSGFVEDDCMSHPALRSTAASVC